MRIILKIVSCIFFINLSAMNKDKTIEITESDYKIFCASKAFINYVKELGLKKGIEFILWEDNFQPGFQETKQGIIVEYTYTYPETLYLPWGFWKFRRDFCHDPIGLANPRCALDLHEALEKNMTLKFLGEEKVGLCVHPKKQYSIIKIDNEELPEASFREHNTSNIPKEEGKKIFAQLIERWKKEHLAQETGVPAAYISTLGPIDT